MADISIRGATKSFGKRQVLEGIDLEIAQGEFVVVLGPSGCGKSTLLRMIAGLENITSGEIAVDGAVVNDVEPSQRGCAMVFQNYALYPHMSVSDNIGYALKVAGVPRAERERRIAEISKTVGLFDYLTRKPSQLSGGQRQRVAMARALIRKPKVFLFDEPLSNLDALLRVQMRLEIRRLHQRLGTTSVFVTHDQIEAMTLADRLVVMNGGRIDQVGVPEEVYARPATRFVARFLGSPPMNLLPARVIGPDALELDSAIQMHGLPVPGIANQSPVDVGFRPEVATIVSLPTKNSFPFVVEFVENVGSSLLCYGTIGVTDAVITLPLDVPVPPATTTLHLAVSIDHLHYFDKHTGRRMALA
jgi:sn-glycerol 3-phosphate transport system ATP-binding protein